MALIGIVGNVLVLGGRVLGQSKRSNGGGGGAHQVEHSLYLRHLAASDLIMGVYLAVIAGVDIMFRYVCIYSVLSAVTFGKIMKYLHFSGEYLRHEEAWRSSILCSCCGKHEDMQLVGDSMYLSSRSRCRLPEHAQLSVVHVPAHINHLGQVGLGHATAAAAQRQPDAVCYVYLACIIVGILRYYR